MSYPDTAAKPEYCAACGRQLPGHRLLIMSKISGAYQPVHNDQRCVDLFNSRNRAVTLAVSDTSNAGWKAP